MKLLKTDDKKKTLKANIRKTTMLSIRAQELSETVQAGRQRLDIFKMLIENNSVQKGQNLPNLNNEVCSCRRRTFRL